MKIMCIEKAILLFGELAIYEDDDNNGYNNNKRRREMMDTSVIVDNFVEHRFMFNSDSTCFFLFNSRFFNWMRKRTTARIQLVWSSSRTKYTQMDGFIVVSNSFISHRIQVILSVIHSILVDLKAMQDFKIEIPPLVQLKSIWYYRQIFSQKWNENKTKQKKI